MSPKKRILLVEDQKETAEVFRAGLESLGHGFQVINVSSAEDALKALEEGGFDLLIADVLLPGISGLELMARFRRRNPNIKVILVSGIHDHEIRKQVARSGAEAFFFKPVELADLLDAVERLFGLAAGVLPLEISAVNDSILIEDKPVKKIADQLTQLRFNLQALSVGLINERGQILARAGTLPDPEIETSLMPHLLSAFFAAGRIAAYSKSPYPDDLQVFRGKEYFIHLSSISPSYAILLVTKPLPPARMAVQAEALQKSIGRLAQDLTQLEKTAKPGPVTSKNEIHTGDTDPHLESVLEKAETRPLSRSQTDKYWKNKDKEMQSAPKLGALTYDQAAQLGLAPKD